MNAQCAICQQSIERITDMVYVLWDGKSENLRQPNHKVCAAAQYERNRRLADGSVECNDCGDWVLDRTAKRLNGLCRQCAARVDKVQDETAGQLIHEERASDGERLDSYLARVRPEIGDQAFWYSECDASRVQVRDHFSTSTGTYTGERWFIRWYDGRHWRVMDLPAGERPRMRSGYCHIVNERATR